MQDLWLGQFYAQGKVKKVKRRRNDFILKVSFQLRFLNFRVKVYFAYRDLSPHRPFQELTQIYTKQSPTSTKETFTF